MTWSVRPFDAHSYTIFRQCYADAELSRRVSVAESWFEYVTQTPGTYAWMVFKNDAPIAVVQFGTEPRPSIMIAINPAERGHGNCKTVLRLIFELPVVRQCDHIYGYIEPDNIASLRCAASLGAVAGTPDADGLLQVTFTPGA